MRVAVTGRRDRPPEMFAGKVHGYADRREQMARSRIVPRRRQEISAAGRVAGETFSKAGLHRLQATPRRIPSGTDSPNEVRVRMKGPGRRRLRGCARRRPGTPPGFNRPRTTRGQPDRHVLPGCDERGRRDRHRLAVQRHAVEPGGDQARVNGGHASGSRPPTCRAEGLGSTPNSTKQVVFVTASRCGTLSRGDA